MNEMFKKEDIKVDYLLEISNEAEKFLTRVCYDNYGALGVASDGFSLDLGDFDDTLRFGWYKVTKIYGRSPRWAVHELTAEFRNLLWEREESKKMTLAEVCEELGYKVEIVDE